MAWTLEGDRPVYCPWCGERLGDRIEEERRFLSCESCDRALYRNPVPMARAPLIDGDAALLIERGTGADVGIWVLPGGHVEADEPPARRRPGNSRRRPGSRWRRKFSLLGTGFLEFETGHTMVSINYAGPVNAASGRLEVGSDASDARFWSRAELREEPPLLRASGAEQVLDAIA